MPKESKAVPMLMDKTRHKSVERLGCHSSTGQFVPFSNGTGHKRASSVLGSRCSQLELLVMPSSLALWSSQKLASDERACYGLVVDFVKHYKASVPSPTFK